MGARIPHNDKTISPTQELSSVAQSKKPVENPTPVAADAINFIFQRFTI